MPEKYKNLFYQTASEAGLSGDEAHTLEKLCASWPYYATHAALLAQNRELAQQPGVELATIGYSRDWQLPIELCAVGNPEPGGINGYIQGPDHGPELIAATTTAVTKQLMVYHPEIYQRLGFDGVLFADHIDPDGMAMQQAWNRQRLTLRRFAFGGWRGHWHDQPSWSYPTSNYYPLEGPEYRQRHPETAASLDVLRTYDPYFFGSIHGSTFSSYIVSSQNNTTMAAQLSRLIEGFGLCLNRDEPEQSGTPVLAPGVFGVRSKETLTQTFSGNATIVQAAGGTNASDHVRADGLMFIPEVGWIEGLPSVNRPPYYTRLQAVRYRTAHAKRLILSAAKGLEDLAPWIENHSEESEIRRLHDAGVFWRDFVGPQLDAELQDAHTVPDNHSQVNQVKFAQLVGTTICNSLVAAGNVHRIAKRARNMQVATRIRNAMDRGIDSVRPIRIVPIEQQLAVQSLAILIGMRHSLHAPTVG